MRPFGVIPSRDVSLDVFCQAFRDGDEGTGDAAAVRAVLEPYVTERGDAFLLLEVDGDTTELYGVGDDGSFMATHIGGRTAWDVLYEAARRGGLVALPAGAPAALTDEAQRAHLPPELAEDAVLVTSGAELLRLVEES